MRGKVELLPRLALCAGITPACAGKSCDVAADGGHGGDHPRVCGEKHISALGRLTRRGSPPRVRGKVSGFRPDSRRPGITPACAGKSLVPTNSTHIIQHHPRVCGEKLLPNRAYPAGRGSPPRVRGKVLSFVLGGAASGITPACAGKSQRTYILAGKAGDHPRVCGEKYWIEDISVPILGSPPRVRGKVLHALLRAHLLHITPACAGKSDSVARLMPVTWDHPRVCGEKLLHRQT